jgi:hypothetical protein
LVGGNFMGESQFPSPFWSGFCSLVHQVVWTCTGFASFGIITPALSVFMRGLSAGVRAGGRLIFSFVRRTGGSAVFFYALTELLIGMGAFSPAQFHTLRL